MEIHAACQKCRKLFSTAEENSGDIGACPVCGGNISVPTEDFIDAVQELIKNGVVRKDQYIMLLSLYGEISEEYASALAKEIFDIAPDALTDNFLSCFCEYTKQLQHDFKLEMVQFIRNIPPLGGCSSRLAGLAASKGIDRNLIARFSDAQAQQIIDKWDELEREINDSMENFYDDIYDEEDEFEIDRLEMSVQTAKNINFKKIFIRVFTIIFLIITIILAVKQWQ